MLRFTNVHLKLMSDIENYQFIKSTIRGSISMIYKGYVEINDKFLKLYNVKKPTSYIIYLDIYLYRNLMMQHLSTEILD